MQPTAPPSLAPDDPRQIREHLRRACQLAQHHGVPSVVVGVAGPEGDLFAPELIDFVESALRVEDAIFRISRERALLFLADVRRAQAEGILARLVEDFRARFAPLRPPAVRLGYYEVAPDGAELLVKDVLPAVFAEASGGSSD